MAEGMSEAKPTEWGTDGFPRGRRPSKIPAGPTKTFQGMKRVSLLIKDHGRIFHLRIPSGVKIIYQPIKGLSLFSDRIFKKGEVVMPLSGKIVSSAHPSPEAVQIDATHFIDSVEYVPEDFINHACRADTMLDVDRKAFIALRRIHRNEEITFNYLTTEWDMKRHNTDFDCICGAKRCFGRIRGFRYLTDAQRKRIAPQLSPFLRSMR